MSKFLRDSFYAFLGEAVMFSGSLLYGLITARALGPSGKGVIGALVAAYAVIVTIMSLRFERAISYYSAAKPDSIHKTVTGTVTMGLVSLACFVALYLFIPESAKRYMFGGVPAEFLAISLILFPSTYLHGAIGAVQAGRRKFESRLVFLLLTNGARVVAAFVALMLLHVPLREFILVFGAVEIITDVLLLSVLFRRNNWRWQIDWTHIRSMMRFSLSGLPGVVAEMTMLNAPILILGVLSGAYDTGLFVVSIMVTNTLAYLANAVKVVVLPHVASASGSIDEPAVLRMLLLIEVAMAVGLILTGRYLLTLLYGPQFEGSFVPALIMIPGAIASTYYGILTASIQGRGRPGLASVPAVIGGTCAVGLSLLLIHDLGISGAAVAKTMANVAGAGVAILIYSKQTVTSLPTMLAIRRAEIQGLASSILSQGKKRFALLRPAASRTATPEEKI